MARLITRRRLLLLGVIGAYAHAHLAFRLLASTNGGINYYFEEEAPAITNNTNTTWQLLPDQEQTTLAPLHLPTPSGEDITITIPKTLVMTWKNMSEIPTWVLDKWRKFNPNYQIIFFDDDDILSFLEKEYNSTYTNFFQQMVFGRYKADFFRYCYLYKKGGVYADVDLDPLVPIDTFLHDNTTFFSVIGRPGSIFQAYIAGVAGHPIFRMAIDKMLEVGPKVGIDPPNKHPYTGHPVRCMHEIVKNILDGKNPSMGLHFTPNGKLQLAQEGVLNTPNLKVVVYYENTIIANSRYGDYNRESGFSSRAG